MEKKNSIFAGLNPPPAPAPPAPFQKFQPQEQPAIRPGPETEAKVSGLEASVKALQAEVAALRQAASKPPPPPAPAQKPDPETAARLARSEGGLEELKNSVETMRELVATLSKPPATKEDLEKVGLNIDDTLASFEAMQRKLAGYAGEFGGIEQECRKSLGEMRGCLRNVTQKIMSERLDAHLKESVSRLADRIADVETAMHAGLGDLSSRLMSDKVLYEKIFAEAEERLRKVLEPDMEAVRGRLKNLSDRIVWLTDEYNIVIERKIRALEAKYSAFDAMAARLEAISGIVLPEKGGPGENRK
jgi:DNA-binding FrmR family transcriptional regulator